MQIQDLGTLKQAAGDNGTTKNAWTGPISLAAALEANPALAATVQKAYAALDKYMVPADQAAPTRCIDGRRSLRYSVSQEAPVLGPQLAGGTTVIALAYRIALGTEKAASFQHDLGHVIGVLSAAHLGIGDHIDDHHPASGEDTGCGAVDRMPLIVERIAQPSAASEINTLARMLLGGAYTPELAAKLTKQIVHFLPAAPHYYGRNDDGHYPFKQRSVQMLRAASPADPIELLEGLHEEKGLLINVVAGTTFNRDAFSSDHQDDIQLFAYDAWFAWTVAEAFPNQRREPPLVLLCHAFYSIATAMVLTDGSLRLLVCQP